MEALKMYVNVCKAAIQNSHLSQNVSNMAAWLLKSPVVSFLDTPHLQKFKEKEKLGGGQNKQKFLRTQLLIQGTGAGVLRVNYLEP